MLIINADDWGRSPRETDVALECQREGRVTSVSAMVFMEDSERAANLAGAEGVDVGLHINLNESFARKPASSAVADAHTRVVRFMRKTKYSSLLYHPLMRKEFRCVFEAQLEEFVRLYGRSPSHFDGHQHRHLCLNMLFGELVPRGEKVRRSFSFWPGEKSSLGRAYRRWVDRWLASRYRVTDYFFSLGQCLRNDRLGRVAELAHDSKVELMTHPMVEEERKFLLSGRFLEFFGSHRTVPYAAL